MVRKLLLRPRFSLTLLALALTWPLGGGALASPAQTSVDSGAERDAVPVRLATDAFGEEARVEVRDLPEGDGEAAARAALEEVLRIERLLDPYNAEPEPGSIASLNLRSGLAPQPVSGPLLRFLARTRNFCAWSDGANGPLGGRLFELWGLRGQVEGRPTPQQLLDATRTAGCRRLEIEAGEKDGGGGAVRLETGSQLDLWPFGSGWAVDRALEILEGHGAANGFVEVGSVRRGLGPGPGGRGWKVTLPILPGYKTPLGTVWLNDEALAIAHYEDRRIEIADDPVIPYIDQRTGRPAEGVVAVIALTELGVDARGLATTMFVTGHVKGQFLLGQIEPEPAVRWLLGTGAGRPLITDFNWTETRRR